MNIKIETRLNYIVRFFDQMPALVKISLFINTLLIFYYIFFRNIHEFGSAILCTNKEMNLVTGEHQDFKAASLLFLLFCYLPLWLFLVGLEIWAVLGAIRYLFINIKQNIIQAFIPFLILSISLAILWFSPLEIFQLNSDFNRKLSEREKVVYLVNSGKIKPDSFSELIDLPEAYKNTSVGGMMKLGTKDKQIIFYTQLYIEYNCNPYPQKPWKIIQDYAGFVYSSDNNKPSYKDFAQDDNEEEFSKIRKIRNNWFWVGTGNIYKQLRL